MEQPRQFAGMLICVLMAATQVAAQTSDVTFNVAIEAGPLEFTRNDVRNPGDTGTPFTFNALDATGPTGYLRLSAEAKVSKRNTLRFLYAPLQVSGTGALTTPTFFESATFQPGVPTKGIYKFSNYRATWRYTLEESERWTVQVGAGVLIRDAKIELQQGTLRIADPDLGVVPIAAFTAQLNATPRLHLVFDFEGLGASQGRALDGAVGVSVDLTTRIYAGAGVRVLDGGVDVESIYNFARIRYGFATLGVRF